MKTQIPTESSEKEFANTEPCCCGSGIAYGRCCKSRRVKCLKGTRGTSNRVLIADQELHSLMGDIHNTFYEAFGRKYGPRDLLINTGLLYSRKEIRREFERIAKLADTPGHLLYAYRKTDGLMLTEKNWELATPQDRNEWEEAVSEYFDAQDLGIDLNEPQTRSEIIFENFPALLSNLVIHLGSYCNRSPVSARKNQSIFFKFILLSKCHTSIKVIMDRFHVAGDDEVLSLLRQIYENSLLFANLSVDPSFSTLLLAQSLAGTELYPYREKKNGDPDYSRIVEASTGREFPSRANFSQLARAISEDDHAFFEAVYPDLSSGVHFDGGNTLRAFMKNGKFLHLGSNSPPLQLIRILVVCDYLLTKLILATGLTKGILRDAKFMRKRLRSYLGNAFYTFDSDDIEIDANSSLFMFACMSDYKLS